MEDLLCSTKNPIDAAREQYYGLQGKNVVFSYANPEAVRAARLEALQEKVHKSTGIKLVENDSATRQQ